MEKMVQHYRGKFDPEWAFAVNKVMTFEGATLTPGDPFDKTLVPTRRLRQLFEARKIVRVVDPEAERSAKDAAAAAQQAARTKLRGLLRRAGARRSQLDALGTRFIDDLVSTTDGLSDAEIILAVRNSGLIGLQLPEAETEEAPVDDISVDDEAALLADIDAVWVDLLWAGAALTPRAATETGTEGQQTAPTVPTPGPTAQTAPKTPSRARARPSRRH